MRCGTASRCDWRQDSASWRQNAFGPIARYAEFIAGVGALAMGASTYEWMLHHVAAPAADPQAAWPCAQPAWLFMHRTLPGVVGADIRFVQGDVRPAHAAMVAAAAGSNV